MKVVCKIQGRFSLVYGKVYEVKGECTISTENDGYIIVINGEEREYYKERFRPLTPLDIVKERLC